MRERTVFTMDTNVLYLIPFILINCKYTDAKASAVATAPMDNVDEGGILSVHCEVENFEKSQSVQILKQSEDGVYTPLSIGDVVQTKNDDRVFLAVRQLPGNTFVYFLSIIDITREDAAEYVCRVMGSDFASISATDTVNINVNYIPGDTNPSCSSSLNSDHVVINEGDSVALTCTSELGKPTVSLHWERTNKELSGRIEETSHNVQNVLEFTASRNDDGSIFMCKLQSSAFPEYERNCHIGPIKVNYDKENVENIPDIKNPVFEVTDFHEMTTAVSTRRPIVNAAEKVLCKDKCSVTSSPALYWIVATIIAACLALLFLIVGIALFIKYNKMTPNIEEYNFQTHQDDFYEKLHYGNRREEMVYMSLGNSNQMKGKGNTEVHYCLAPNKASFTGAGGH